MTTKEENETLRNILKNGSVKENDNNDSRFEIKNEQYLEYTPIKLKSREAIRRGHEMEDFMDKTYYFNEIIINKYYNGNLDLYFSELQFTYMNTVLFGNYGSSLQWHSMIEVFCFTKKIRNWNNNKNNMNDVISTFDDILYQQLTLLPEEYIEMLLNEDMWSKCLLDSYQGPKLSKTRELMKKKLPQIFKNSKSSETVNKDTDEQYTKENDMQEDGNSYMEEDEQDMLPPIDSDNEDDDGPVIVERLIYR